MKKNLSVVDSFIRLFVAVILVDLATEKTATGYWNILAWVFASLFFLTAYLGWSPLYALFGIHTNRRTPPHSARPPC